MSENSRTSGVYFEQTVENGLIDCGLWIVYASEAFLEHQLPLISANLLWRGQSRFAPEVSCEYDWFVIGHIFATKAPSTLHRASRPRFCLHSAVYVLSNKSTISRHSPAFTVLPPVIC